ncbi:MAG: hypothetical protein ACLU0O_08735 [Collinsella sp.]
MLDRQGGRRNRYHRPTTPAPASITVSGRAGYIRGAREFRRRRLPASLWLSLPSSWIAWEGYADLADMYEGIAKMDRILPAAREKGQRRTCDRFAACARTTSSCISWDRSVFSQTYGFAICSLMEMQWQSCAYIHSGSTSTAFEVTEPGVFYFLQMSSSECRAMGERALAFLETHTDTLMVLDAMEYGMDQVPASVRAFLDQSVLRDEL